MSRVALPKPEILPTYLRNLHDNTRPDDWSTRHVALAFFENEDLLQRYLEFYYPFHRSEGAGVVESRLKELVRLRIATLNGCKTCRAARLDRDNVSEHEAAIGVDEPEGKAFTPREHAALNLAEMMAVNHFSIDDRMVRELRQHFSQRELLELMMMIGQYIGFGRMLAILQLEETTCPI